MKIIKSFPHKVSQIENCWIPMRDGRRLAARLWLPEGAHERPVPAVIEYIPYRKRDRTRQRDEPIHHYFAGHGYAALRIDVRGSGDSEGLLVDEYHEQELRDGVEAIAWAASQPWCNGAVGMMGKSWGGINSLQIAARRPPALKAIITLCSTDDRYADDAHYMGGCLLNENLIWGSVLFTINAQPPDPEIVGERWREMWLERLEGTPLFVETWLRHAHRDEYWKHGSVCEDFSRIACPVYAVSGWVDGYSNAVPRLLAGLKVPCKGLIGPWAHLYPHAGVPGPAIGFLQEALRWWDHWLRGADTGIMNEPRYRVWMQESVPPAAFYKHRPGRWVAEATWPSPRIERRSLHLTADGGLGGPGAAGGVVEYAPRQTVGLAAGKWCSFAVAGDLAGDQRPDDDISLTFDSQPFEVPIEILGAPEVVLKIAADRPTGFVAARVNDVSPEGWVSRVTYGLLNLTQRSSRERPQPVEAGGFFTARIRLNDIAHVFPAGHRVRLSLSTSYWPTVWPSPQPVTVRVDTRGSALELPVRPPRPEDEGLAPFEAPETAPPVESTDLHESETHRTVRTDPRRREIVVEIRTDETEHGGPALTRIEPIDLEFGHGATERYRIRESKPLSAEAEMRHDVSLCRGGWSARIKTRTQLTATREEFRLRAEIEAIERGIRVFRKKWNRKIPRNMI